MIPKPVSVQYNDWREVEVPAPAAFTPTLPVSVLIPYYQTPVETLAKTLAALECQTYPRDLFEVVIVDDGSDPPLERPLHLVLDVKVVRQERRGFGIARARNTGARAAAHDILLFLDSDMLPEAGWMAAHARWHHAVVDALTAGFTAYVAMDGIDAATIRHRPGSLNDLFTGRAVDPPWVEGHMIRTNDLTSRDDDPFWGMGGNNFGIGKNFYHLVGGSDESFSRWGMEDTELAYRVYTRGGLIVPTREAFAWHQGRKRAVGPDTESKHRSLRLQHGKTSHLVAHRDYRDARPGRIYAVPQYVVTINARNAPADRVIETTAIILADRVHDLVVRIETSASSDDEGVGQIRETFDPDPRVRVAPTRSALDEFPTAAFHVTLPAGVMFAKDLVYRLRTKLGYAVTATSDLPDGSHVSMTRAWALHRACRTGRHTADFGDIRTLPAAALKLKVGPARHVAATRVGCPKWVRVRNRVQDLHGLGEAWTLVKWLAYRCLRPLWGGRIRSEGR